MIVSIALMDFLCGSNERRTDEINPCLFCQFFSGSVFALAFGLLLGSRFP